jgi:glycosyltransferase involved in cell wall biosynthesis
MRVLLLTYEYPPLVAGAEAATHALARGLAARGVTVDVVTGGPQGDSDAERVWQGSALSAGLLTVHRVRRGGGREGGVRGAIGYLRAAMPLARRLLDAEQYDVAHFVFSLPTGAMLPFLDLRGMPVVVTLCGSDVPGFDRSHHSVERVHRVLRPLTRWIWRHADRVIATSDSLGRLARLTLPQLRYSVVPNGVDLTRFRPRLRASGSHPRLRCLAVAPLVERSGLAQLIWAVALQARGTVELEIVGTGPQEPALRALADELGVSALVRFAGARDRTTIAQRYRDADLFTLAGGGEATGAVVAEAMASGLPIVGSSLGEIPELVREGVNGSLVPPGDTAALAAAIARMAASPRTRAEMGRRSRARAEEHLDCERVSDRHLALYRGVQRSLPARRLLSEEPSSTW